MSSHFNLWQRSDEVTTGASEAASGRRIVGHKGGQPLLDGSAAVQLSRRQRSAGAEELGALSAAHMGELSLP